MEWDGKLQEPEKGRMIKNSDHLQKKDWIIPPNKEPSASGVLAVGKGSMDWVVEGGSYKYQL